MGVKCEVERTLSSSSASLRGSGEDDLPRGDAGWVSLSIEIPGRRDDDALPVFLGSMLTEALVQGGFLPRRLVINRLWHWRIWIDVCSWETSLTEILIVLLDTPSFCTTFISSTIAIVDYASRTAGHTSSTSNKHG